MKQISEMNAFVWTSRLLTAGGFSTWWHLNSFILRTCLPNNSPLLNNAINLAKLRCLPYSERRQLPSYVLQTTKALLVEQGCSLNWFEFECRNVSDLPSFPLIHSVGLFIFQPLSQTDLSTLFDLVSWDSLANSLCKVGTASINALATYYLKA